MEELSPAKAQKYLKYFLNCPTLCFPQHFIPVFYVLFHPVKLKAACTSFKLCECGETSLVCNTLTENAPMLPKLVTF